MIHMENIDFVREQRTILNNVHLLMNPGEHWVILGKNGSGKTTLLEMMNGYLFPTKGSVEVLGHRYGQCDVREVRKQIGYISQSLIEKLTLQDPVWEVVATGVFGYLRFYEEVPPHLKEQAVAALRQVKLDSLADQPFGLLSQGERKKALLARALMSEPKILIMDEPCAGLDLYEREKLLEDLEGISRQSIQLIYVTHHIEEIVPVFTHVALVHEGSIAAAGAKEQVLTSETLQQAFQVPVEVRWIQNRPWIHVTA